MSTDATTTDGRTTDDTPQTEAAAGSAAERLGGPSSASRGWRGRARRRLALVGRPTQPRRRPMTLDPTPPPKSAPR